HQEAKPTRQSSNALSLRGGIADAAIQMV
ncbi:MAG: hypothetical protein AWT59_3269, partial [Candidatus Gallionella acididurans]